MTRIIQRCFLVLAFTGVLLLSAQETTSSDTSHSTPQSSETSSSAPESSSDSVGPPSSSSPVVKTEDESSSYPSTTATGSSNADVTTGVLDDKSSGSTAGTASAIQDESTSESKESGSSEDSDKVQKSTELPDDSGRLRKAELHDEESQAVEIPTEKNPESSDKSIDGESAKDESSGGRVQNASDSSVSNSSNETTTEDPDAASETSSVSETVAGESTTTTIAALQSSEANFSENATNDSGQSSVPSKEETIYNSSSVDKNQTPEEMSSTSSSKVQTEENGTADSSKSATRKRSLNATNTASSSTSATAVDSEQVRSSSTPAVAAADGATTLPSGTTEAKDIDGEIFVTMKQPFFVEVLPNVQATSVKDESVTETEVTESKATDFPHAINSAIPNADSSVAHFHESEPPAGPMSSHEDVHLPPISSAALSTLTEDSIHRSESIGTTTTAQAPNDSRRGGISTASSEPQRYPELEIETAVPTGHQYPSPFTFDPDGLTHNFSQDPDSVTFSPGLFHVDGLPGRLVYDESWSLRPEIEREVFITGGTTIVQESSTSRKTEEGLYPFEREREFMPSSNPGALPHDEPDIEDIMYSRNFAPSTVHPAMAGNPSSTTGSLDVHTQDNGKLILPLNDESEEMLNDSPHFVQIQSKPAAAVTTSTAEVKDQYSSKGLEMTNFGNDITHHTIVSPSPQNNDTMEAANELDLSTEYHHTEQSEIRPVTAASPLNPLESTTLTTRSPPVPTESRGSANSDTVLPDTSSPIANLSNPAPPIAASNKSVDETTKVTVSASQPDYATAQAGGDGSASDAGREDELTTVNSTSTIAGVAVRTSVSVSIPLSTISNDTLYSENSTVIQDGNETNASSNGSEIILPIPIPVNKDADGHPAPTVASPTEAQSPSTTESSIPRIRKPKLKINSGDSDSTPGPRTRKPFIVPPQKTSTTVGPPVSIFKKARTRIASITSSTTARPFPQFSTIRVHYASRLPPGMVPGGELVVSTEPVTTTVPTTTETEEPFSDEPFTEQTQGPIISSEDDVTLIRVAGYIVIEKGLRWNNQLDNRHSPQYKEKANFVTMQLYRLFRTSPVATRLWQVKIDGFSIKKPRSVAIDFFLLLIKTPNEITMDQLTTVFHDKLKNNTFSRFTVDTNKTSFELLDYESIKPTTEPPEEEPEPVIPQWAIAVIVVGAASLIFIVLFAAVAILGRHHVRRRYSSKLSDEDSDRPSDWESKMAAAYENLAADTIYDAEDLPSDSYKKSYLVD